MPPPPEHDELEPVPDCLIELGLTTLTPALWARIKELDADLPPLTTTQRDRLRLIFRASG